MKEYGKFDLVFLTNVPSFYKVKMLNELARTQRVCAIFTMSGTEGRAEDFFKGDRLFEYCCFSGGQLKNSLSIIHFISHISYNYIIINGWDEFPKWIVALFSRKSKNLGMTESSIYESNSKGILSVVKRLFLSRLRAVFVPGIANSRLIEELGYKGPIVKIGSCGILRFVEQVPYIKKSNVSKFLYVGRLSPEKNLELLISVFNRLPNLMLDIIGYGPKEFDLKGIAHDNIHFLGEVNNEELPFYYRNSDVLILPSKSEPWGLVIEEALNNGLPVIASDMVGCREDLVTDKYGLVFEALNENSLEKAVLDITNIDLYNKQRRNISELDFNSRTEKLLSCFSREFIETL